VSTLRVGNLTAVGGTGTITVPSGNVLTQAGTILQVVSTTKTDVFTTTSSSLVDVTGLSATITPSATSSKILVQVTMYGGATSTGGGIGDHVALLRGSTQIGLGDAAGNRFRAFSSMSQSTDTQYLGSLGGSFLDSPATTSATTYKIQIRTSSGTFAINRNGNDADLVAQPRTISTITLLEVAG